jgi:hypothetical protein
MAFRRIIVNVSALCLHNRLSQRRLEGGRALSARLVLMPGWRHVAQPFLRLAQVDHITRRDVDVHERCRSGRRLMSVERQHVFGGIETDVFGRCVEKFDQARRCSQRPIGDSFAGPARDKHLYVRLLQPPPTDRSHSCLPAPRLLSVSCTRPSAATGRLRQCEAIPGVPGWVSGRLRSIPASVCRRRRSWSSLSVVTRPEPPEPA